MGKDNGGGDFLASPLTQEAIASSAFQRKVAKALFEETSPIRQDAFPLVQGTLGRFNDPIDANALASTPQFGAFKAATEGQFDTARQRVLESLPVGGQLGAGLANVERGRAQTLTSGLGALATDEAQQRQADLNRALGLSTGGAQIALGGAGAAGSNFANLAGSQAAIAQSQAAASAGKAGDFGQALGFVVGSKVGGPPGAKAGSTIGGSI